MATFSLGEAVLGTKVDLDGLDKGLGQGERASRDWVNRVGGVLAGAGRFAVAGITLASAAVAGLGVSIGNLAIQAAPLATIEAAFEGIAESAGETADSVLRDMGRASAGMIAQRDLMVSFNRAAQLVSEDFALRLPDAMEALGKVAAATGQDMGFLLDSLVTGIGRVSPMILDNLGIQVDLTAAMEAYAAQIGKNVSELTKEEQQAALTNQVLEKLAENTAAMPEVAGTAAGGIANLQASLQNLKDEVGLAFQPALSEVVRTLNGLLEIGFGPLVNFIETHVVPIVNKITQIFGTFFGGLMSGASPVEALRVALQHILPPELADKIVLLIAKGLELADSFLKLGGEMLNTALGGADFKITLDDIIKALDSVIYVIEATRDVVEDMRYAWEQVVVPVISLIRNVRELGTTLSGVRLPKWLTPGSPTPFELGIRGINEAMQDLTKVELPALALRMNTMGGASETNNFNLTINSQAQREDLKADFDMLRAFAGV